MQKNKRTNTRYSPEFKISVIIDMRNNHLGYKETMRKYIPHKDPKNFNLIKKWERIYLEEGEARLYIERR